MISLRSPAVLLLAAAALCALVVCVDARDCKYCYDKADLTCGREETRASKRENCPPMAGCCKKYPLCRCFDEATHSCSGTVQTNAKRKKHCRKSSKGSACCIGQVSKKQRSFAPTSADKKTSKKSKPSSSSSVRVTSSSSQVDRNAVPPVPCGGLPKCPPAEPVKWPADKQFKSVLHKGKTYEGGLYPAYKLEGVERGLALAMHRAAVAEYKQAPKYEWDDTLAQGCAEWVSYSVFQHPQLLGLSMRPASAENIGMADFQVSLPVGAPARLSGVLGPLKSMIMEKKCMENNECVTGHYTNMLFNSRVGCAMSGQGKDRAPGILCCRYSGYQRDLPRVSEIGVGATDWHVCKSDNPSDCWAHEMYIGSWKGATKYNNVETLYKIGNGEYFVQMGSKAYSPPPPSSDDGNYFYDETDADTSAQDLFALSQL